jgi:hypothetical protein
MHIRTRTAGSSPRDFLDNYETHQVGGRTIVEYWIPAEDRHASLRA